MQATVQAIMDEVHPYDLVILLGAIVIVLVLRVAWKALKRWEEKEGRWMG